jgi:hypothetical protein
MATLAADDGDVLSGVEPVAIGVEDDRATVGRPVGIAGVQCERCQLPKAAAVRPDGREGRKALVEVDAPDEGDQGAVC